MIRLPRYFVPITFYVIPRVTPASRSLSVMTAHFYPKYLRVAAAREDVALHAYCADDQPCP